MCALRQALGEGAFGRVMQASAADIVHSGENTTVAVKMLKEGHTDQVRSDREKCLYTQMRGEENNR